MGYQGVGHVARRQRKFCRQRCHADRCKQLHLALRQANARWRQLAGSWAREDCSSRGGEVAAQFPIWIMTPFKRINSMKTSLSLTIAILSSFFVPNCAQARGFGGAHPGGAEGASHGSAAGGYHGGQA